MRDFDVWKIRVANYQNSKKSLKKWCQENGFKRSCLRYWINRIEAENEITWSKIVVDDTCVPSVDNDIVIAFKDCTISVESSRLYDVLKVVKELA